MTHPLTRRSGETEGNYLLREFTRYVAYSDHWLRNTEVFEKALKYLNMEFEYRGGGELYETTRSYVPSPYDGTEGEP